MDVVKIDVEGAEMLVLDGFGDYIDKVRYMIVEVHPHKMRRIGTHVGKLYLKLLSRGFIIYRIDDNRGLINLKRQVQSLGALYERHHILAKEVSAMRL